MQTMPRDIGAIHFVGIGGIGMSGIAEVLHTLGYAVRGSDLTESANVARLRALGIRIEAGGHKAENIADAEVVVVSSAVKDDNPEVAAARARRIPVVRRAEMLAELMRLKWSVAVGGTHGKTTTTSLIAAVLDACKGDPTVINGGIINAYGTNARLGAGDWMVVEADESDGTFTKLPATVAVVTNIDPEHLDHYGSFDALRAAFLTFLESIPFYGFATVCLDDPEVQALVGKVRDRKLVTYGFNAQADVRIVTQTTTPDGCRFSVAFEARGDKGPVLLKDVLLPMHGAHNVKNALAALAVAWQMGLDLDQAKAGLAGFGGVKRRFTATGTGAGIRVIDDYGHHPVEIAAVLSAARQVGAGKVVAVVQPHRYSRLRDLFDEFCASCNDADTVLVADVFPAGEPPIEGIDRDALVRGLAAHGHKDARALTSPETLAAQVLEVAGDGDLVVCLGAGNITHWANALPEALAQVAGGGA